VVFLTTLFVVDPEIGKWQLKTCYKQQQPTQQGPKRGAIDSLPTTLWPR